MIQFFSSELFELLFVEHLSDHINPAFYLADFQKAKKLLSFKTIGKKYKIKNRTQLVKQNVYKFYSQNIQQKIALIC